MIEVEVKIVIEIEIERDGDGIIDGVLNRRIETGGLKEKD